MKFACVVFFLIFIINIKSCFFSQKIAPWKNGIVTYTIDRDISDDLRERIRGAMDAWESVCNVQFIESENGEYKIGYSDNNKTSSSTIGSKKIRDESLRLEISRSAATWEINSILLHELGHCLGLTHEHMREDRDKYITIIWENIEPKYKKLFFKTYNPLIDEKKFHYDYDSIMHYPEKIFSKNKKAIDTHGKKTYFISLTISEEDIKKIQSIYGGSVKESPIGICFNGYTCMGNVRKFQCFGRGNHFFDDRSCSELKPEQINQKETYDY